MFKLRVNEHVVLKLRDESHAQESFDLIIANPQLKEWMNWYDKVRNVRDALDNIEANIEDWDLKTDYHLGVFYDDTMVGMISLHGINYLNHTAAIGYWLAADHEGRGIITESVRALLDHAFGELNLNKIGIGAGVTNYKSRRIPERLGFTLDGILREHIRLNGQYFDLALYSILKKDYLTQKHTR